MAQYPAPQQQNQVLVPPLWTCGKCNAINGSNHSVCSSCGSLKQSGPNQQVYYFAPNSNPTIVLPPPQKQSHVTVTVEIAALIAVLLTVIGGGGALLAALTPHPTYQYYSFQYNQPITWQFPVDSNQGIIVAHGVTTQDVPFGNSNIKYNYYYGPLTLNVTITYGYVELVSPVNRSWAEYCRHLSQAVNNGIHLQYSCSVQ